MPGQPDLSTLRTLASELQEQGKYDEAEPYFRQALEVTRETLGNGHPDTIDSINHLAGLLFAKGGVAASVPLYREELEACES